MREITAAPVMLPANKRLTNRAYRHYVLGLLFLAYMLNAIDRSPVLSVSLQAIKEEFHASDTMLGLLSGIPFALFYSTFGVPLALWADRSSRRTVLTLAVALWSAMTAVCGMVTTLAMLFAARVGTAIGESGGSPPSHSLISDYFPKSERGVAFSLFALGAPIGTAVGSYIAGQTVQEFGWRATFMLFGLPGLVLALLIRLTLVEPPRGFADGAAAQRSAALAPQPSMRGTFRALWARRSFRHVTLAAALHSVVWYAGSAFNAAFLIRSHAMNVATAGTWLTVFAGVGVLGTFLGGRAADRLSTRTGDRRWYLRVPGIATLIAVPIQFGAYLIADPRIAFPLIGLMMFLASVFLGPSFAMTQALAPVRMRSIAASLLLLIQSVIGFGVGPLLTGRISDWLAPEYGTDALRYALVIVGITNVWAALHYFRGTRTLLRDLEQTEQNGLGTVEKEEPHPV